jgi:hypothetical protein
MRRMRGRLGGVGIDSKTRSETAKEQGQELGGVSGAYYLPLIVGIVIETASRGVG